MSAQWQASWIWGEGEESPRNAWRCFRRSFIPEAGVSVAGAKARITADSRYVLFVNGIRVGRGPVRSWPTSLPYDEYEIGHLLTPGVEAVVSAIVTHYGISTFQYLRGRGGLLLELDGVRETGGGQVATDGSWKTIVHRAFERNASRISCQLPFTETYDARGWDESWTQAGFDDGAWEPARVIGPVGMAPWIELVERPIPYLTEEPKYPARVEALGAAKAPAWTAALDVRTIMVPESADHANNVSFVGLLATNVALERAGTLTIGIVDDGRTPAAISVDGRALEKDAYYGAFPERYVDVELTAGEHFLLLDVSGTTHGHAFHLAFDAGGAPFAVRSPLPELGDAGTSPFVAVGPFDKAEHIDHEAPRTVDRGHPEYARVRGVASPAELASFGEWLRPVDARLVDRNDVFAATVWKTATEPRPVPVELQRAVLPSPDPAVVPVFDGFDTELVIDFGRELSGYVAFELDAAGGTVVDGYGFEYMKDGWKQHTYQLDNTFRYVCREGRQSYVSYVRRGLRYLALTFRGAARPVRLYEIKLLQSNFPVADVGRFRSSDPLLNDIWTLSRDTTRLCMEDTFVDCPAFEQTYWVGDARNEALVNYYVFGAKDIVEHCLKLVPGSAFQTPLFADQVPSGWSSVIPNWTFFWISACREYYAFSGDRSFAEAVWPSARLTLDTYAKLLNEDGLMEREGWNLLDWAPFEQPREGVVTPQSMFFAKALREGAELAALAGDDAEAERLRAKASLLRDAIDAKLWDESRGAYLDCLHADGRPSKTISMQTQIVAYLCDIPEGDRKRCIEEYIAHPPASFVQVGSPFMSFFYYEAFAKLGRYDLLLADMRRNYGFMVEHDATACWEMYPWSGYNPNPKMLTRSHCHAWSAGPAYFLGAYVLGVQGANPGWTRVRIAPQPCGLQWAIGSVPLPQGGRVDVSWRIEGERGDVMRLRVEAPAGVELDVRAPEGFELTVERVAY